MYICMYIYVCRYKYIPNPHLHILAHICTYIYMYVDTNTYWTHSTVIIMHAYMLSCSNARQVTCDMSHVTCHMSRVSSHMWHVTVVWEMTHTGWLRLVGSSKLLVSFAKEPYTKHDILQKRLIILRSLLIVATP